MFDEFKEENSLRRSIRDTHARTFTQTETERKQCKDNQTGKHISPDRHLQGSIPSYSQTPRGT